MFGWRACNDILPTKMNLMKRRIINDVACPICMRFLESAIHVLWECDAAQDVWAGSLKILQKGITGMIDMLQLMEYLPDRVTGTRGGVSPSMVNLESEEQVCSRREVS